jgi:transcriptional regulator with XRE-family HTH domain
MPRRAVVDRRFAARLRRLLAERGLSYRALAALTHYGKSHVHDLATGRRPPTPETAQRLDEVLDARGVLAALVSPAPVAPVDDDELAAIDLLRRVEVSDVSDETLTRLELAVDDLATAYARTAPVELLARVRRHLQYVGTLVDARMTLGQRSRLLTAGGWLSLLAATVHIDLRHTAAADARLGTANAVAVQVDHPEIRAWCLETRAWDALTDGHYGTALDLSRQAQTLAQRGSSAHIQATAQEGRAWARMGQQAETRAVLDRISQLTAALAVPDRPEHHYHYDPDKALAYTATTLAWAGDPAAEEYARAVIRRLEVAADGVARPRRIASAQVDLGLALLAAGQPDEAVSVTTAAIVSGRIVPSNWWRVTEVVAGVERTGVREADSLRDAYEALRPDLSD